MSLEQKKELHELCFKGVNIYLQEKFKIQLLEKSGKKLYRQKLLYKKEMYMVDRVKRNGAHD